MKKKIMSIIAATAVMITSSPICANALYKEVISKQDYSDYVKVDFMSDEKADVYIYNGNDIDENAPYRRNAIREEKMNDRIYLNVKEGITASELGGLLKEFRTENGDSLQIHANNTFNKEYSYYITPSVFKENEPLKKISSNDARKIKELLAKDNSATEMFYTTDVCNPANGVMDLTFFYYPDQYYKENNVDKQVEIKRETEQIVRNYVTNNNLDVSLKFVEKNKESFAHIEIVPISNLSIEDYIIIVEQIMNNCYIYPENGWQVSTNEDFSAIDLLNAVDGDTNCDEQMDMSDAVLVMQALANPNKYGLDGTAEHHLTKQGKFNADMDGDGLTVGDAQAIQKKLLGLDKADSQSIDSSLIANKLFRYEKSADPGILDDLCDLSFGSNGQYFYHIGYYKSSNQDQGTWTISGDTVVLTGQYGTNKFRYEDKALVYIAEESDGFSEFNDKSTPKDGEKFILAEEPDYAAINNLSEIVTIKTDYNPIMSDWSGIGILLEFDSKDYSISLRTNDGHFTTWDIAKGSGPIKNAGVTYDIGNSGYIFWTPGGFEFDADYQNEIVIIGEKDGKSVKLGSIIVTPSNNHTLTAVLK